MKIVTRSLAPLAILLSLIAFPEAAFADGTRPGGGPFSPTLEGYFIGGFLGEYQVRADGSNIVDGDLDLDPTLGGGMRLAFGGDWFRWGLMTEFRGYGSGQSDYLDRDFAFDLDPFIGLKIPVARGRNASFFIRGTVPFGYTLFVPDDDRLGDENYHGFNTGALAGVELAFRRAGLFAEAGVRYHRVYSSSDLIDDANVSWAQLSINTGAAFYF